MTPIEVPRHPASDEPTWASLRRAHFYLTDVIYQRTETFDVGPAERRLLDAIRFAQFRGAERGLSVAEICALVLTNTKPQTAASTLTKMAGRRWVDRRNERATGRRRGRLWHLTERGLEVREQFKRIAEDTLAEPDQWIDDQRGTGHTDEGQPRVVVEHQAGIGEQRDRLTQ